MTEDDILIATITFQESRIIKFSNIKILKEIGSSNYFYVSSENIRFFQQIDPSWTKDKVINTMQLYPFEFTSFENKTYYISIKYTIENCSEWEILIFVQNM